jgi:hypothetical protein
MVSWGLIDNATNSIIDYGNTSFVTNPSSVSYHPNHTFHFNEFDIHLHYMETGNYTVFGHFMFGEQFMDPPLQSKFHI